MKNPDKPRIRDLVSILLFFAFIGVGVGTIAGSKAVVQNGYLSHGMLEITFWTVAKSINHHLLIFLAIAVCNIAAFSVLRVMGFSSRGAIDTAIIPFSILSILYIYGRPLWVVFRANPERLLGKADTMIFLGIMVLMIFFVSLWYFWLRKNRKGVGPGLFLLLLTRRVALAVVGILIVGANIFDFVDWSRSGKNTPNLVLVSLDTLRADHLGCYGHDREISPHIDAFASESIQFMKAISQSSWTLPAHASLFTGYYPSAIGAVNKHRIVPPSFLMLGEILRDAGYSTTAFTGGGYLNPIYGFGQGFDAYEHYSAFDSESVWRFIDGTGDRPFFLFLHTYKIHNYYVPPELLDRLDDKYKEEFRNLESIMTFVDRHLVEDLDEKTRPMMEHLRDRYELSILHIDQQFGSLMNGLEERGLLDETLVVVISDHGEEFGEHGRTYHGGTLYNEQIHVPLLIRLPRGKEGGRKIPEIVELMDVFPTILDYLDMSAPVEIDGESLTPLIEGVEGFEGKMAFSEISSLVTEKYAVCDSAGKLIYAPDVTNLPLPGIGSLEMFELTWGPNWTENPTSKEGDPLVEPFQRWYTKMIGLRETGYQSEEIILDPILQEELKALGYIR
jgi:hypothetical protein